MKPCELCEAIHDSILCDDRDMTILGICRICAGVIRVCYRHKADLKIMQHTECIGKQPVSLTYYNKQVKFVNENLEICNKLTPIPAHVISPEEWYNQKPN